MPAGHLDKASALSNVKGFFPVFSIIRKLHTNTSVRRVYWLGSACFLSAYSETIFNTVYKPRPGYKPPPSYTPTPTPYDICVSPGLIIVILW